MSFSLLQELLHAAMVGPPPIGVQRGEAPAGSRPPAGADATPAKETPCDQ